MRCTAQPEAAGFCFRGKTGRSLSPASGLFALALLLGSWGKKGYEIRWHTECSGLKEPLLCRGLTEEEASADLQSFSALKLTRTELEAGGEERFRKWAGQADAVCLAPELFAADGDGEAGLPGKLFLRVAGRRRGSGCSMDPGLGKIYRGQGGQISAGCFRRTAFLPPALQESRLYVTMDGVKGSRALTEEKAPDRENGGGRKLPAASGVSGLECVKGCAYLQQYKRNPRGAIREIYNNLSIVMGNHMANGMINACDLCGQCRAACPNGFDYPAVCAMARRIMVETEKMPPSAHEFGLLDQQFSLRRGLSGKASAGG